MIGRDFTQGYGPEEYMVKIGPAGLYKIRAKYFASHQQSLSGGTTILLSIFTNYSRPDEQQQLITVRLSTNADIVDVGEIQFVPTSLEEIAKKNIAEMEVQIQQLLPQIKLATEEFHASQERRRKAEAALDAEIAAREEEQKAKWREEDAKKGRSGILSNFFG